MFTQAGFYAARIITPPRNEDRRIVYMSPEYTDMSKLLSQKNWFSLWGENILVDLAIASAPTPTPANPWGDGAGASASHEREHSPSRRSRSHRRDSSSSRHHHGKRDRSPDDRDRRRESRRRYNDDDDDDAHSYRSSSSHRSYHDDEDKAPRRGNSQGGDEDFPPLVPKPSANPLWAKTMEDRMRTLEVSTDKQLTEVKKLVTSANTKAAEAAQRGGQINDRLTKINAQHQSLTTEVSTLSTSIHAAVDRKLDTHRGEMRAEIRVLAETVDQRFARLKEERSLREAGKKLKAAERQKRDADIAELQREALEAQRRLQVVEDDSLSLTARLDNANIPDYSA